MAAVTVDGDVFAFERLDDEIGYHATVVGVHARSVGIEEAGHFNAEVMLTAIVKEQCFGTSFALVVAGAEANGVHIAPVIFSLRMNVWIPIYLAG